MLGASFGGVVTAELVATLRQTPEVVDNASAAAMHGGAVPRALSHAFSSIAGALAVLGGAYGGLTSGSRADVIGGGESGVVVGTESGAIVVAQDSDPRSPTRLPLARVLPQVTLALSSSVASVLVPYAKEIVSALHAALCAPMVATGAATTAAAEVVPSQAAGLLADLRARAALVTLMLYSSDALGPDLVASMSPLLLDAVRAAGGVKREALREAASSDGKTSEAMPRLNELCLRAHDLCGTLFERPQLPIGATAASAFMVVAASDTDVTVSAFLAKAAKPKKPKSRAIEVGGAFSWRTGTLTSCSMTHAGPRARADRVRVRAGVTPRAGWGSATATSIGVVVRAADEHVVVDLTAAAGTVRVPEWPVYRTDVEIIPDARDDDDDDGDTAVSATGVFSVTDSTSNEPVVAGAAAAAAYTKLTGADGVSAGIACARHRAWSYDVASLQLLGAVAAGEAAAACVRACPTGVPHLDDSTTSPEVFVSVVQRVRDGLCA